MDILFHSCDDKPLGLLQEYPRQRNTHGIEFLSLDVNTGTQILRELFLKWSHIISIKNFADIQKYRKLRSFKALSVLRILKQFGMLLSFLHFWYFF